MHWKRVGKNSEVSKPARGNSRIRTMLVFGKIKMDTGDSQHIYSGEDSAGETKERY